MRRFRSPLDSLALIIAVWGALVALTGCDASHSKLETLSISSLATTPEQIDAFQSTLYSFGSQQGCVNCHSTRVNPSWMNSDVRTAYNFARPFVDFNDPTASVFAIYAGNNHCNNPVCANPANVAVVKSLLSQWAAQEIVYSSGGAPVAAGSTLANPSFVTAAMPIPAILPDLTAATSEVVRFDLSQLTPPVPALNGAILEISIRSYNSLNTEYKVYSPRILGITTPVTFIGMHVYLKVAGDTGLGVEDVNQGDQWANLNATALPFAMPSPLSSGPTITAMPLTPISLGLQALSATDVLTIGFAGIQ